MSSVFVELSGESLELARAETEAAAAALGGHAVGPLVHFETIFEVDLDRKAVATLPGRLALAHRCLVPAPLGGEGLPLPGRPLASASFRPFRQPSGGARNEPILRAARAWKEKGGVIDLEDPNHRFWMLTVPEGTPIWLEEVGSVDRPAVSARRMSALPFRRPIGLDPRLARAAANLARIAPGDRVIDPFVGTGALLAEAALLGARVVGIDRDATMVLGALRNFAHFGVSAETMVAGDSGTVELPGVPAPFDALLTDLPYGRSSGTGGEEAARLARRVLPRWADRVRPGGRLVIVLHGGADPVDRPWRRALSVPVRAHRSLTREFRVYERRS